MIYGFNKDYIGKHVWAFVPDKNGGLTEKHGVIRSFFNSVPFGFEPYYMIKYEGSETATAASPEWLIFEPSDE